MNNRPAVHVTTVTDVQVTEGVTVWLQIRIPLAHGHPGAGVPMAEVEEGLDLAQAVMELLPPAARRAVARVMGKRRAG